MKYIAHAAVRLQNGILDEQKNKWFHIKTVGNIEYRWRVCGDRFCEVIAGVFNDKFDALRCAKRMQVTLLYASLGKYTSLEDAVPSFYSDDLNSDISGVIKDGESVFHSIRARQRFPGPGVFEVNNSLDEFDDYQPLTVTITTSSTVYLNLSNIDVGTFSYNRDVHDLFQSIVGIKFFLADGDALFRGADVDGVLVFVVCHKKVLRFSISRNGELRVRLQKGCRKLTTARQRDSPFRSAATRSKGSRCYLVVR